ncbi:MAG: NDP-hexose 2,3-dehydratase family protein [Hyphomonadaceae bacterium JAD_PAG50586_4]|nr:MAG: NDP-hexose 2,3-dehydratase family protein [Hyphomonadaceae bacterium JAD_PAG50586_4]
MPTFDEAVAAYTRFLGGPIAGTQSRLRIEAHVETQKDWSPLHTMDEVRAWYLKRAADCPMKVESIPVLECREWSLHPETGTIRHKSGEFFYVEGLRVSNTGGRENSGGWDQPMLTQVGFDGGILGLLRQRKDSVPLYLVEAKAEPGNYRMVQISPTLQATFSNLKRAHAGRKPRFAEYFEAPAENGALVHYDQWMSEDGGRLTNKRNKGMIVEAPADKPLEAPDGFMWLSLWQIKECFHDDAWINPHLRMLMHL